MTELKSCAFCSNKPSVSEYYLTAMGNDVPLYQCPNANCPASVIRTSLETWNRRSREDAMQAVMDRLVNCLESALNSLDNLSVDEDGIDFTYDFVRGVHTAKGNIQYRCQEALAAYKQLKGE